MAHQTPRYLTSQGSDHLCESVMVNFPFCNLFSGFRRQHDPNKGNDVMDAIEFPPTTAGPHRKASPEEMQSIIDDLYAILDELHLMEKFREEVEDLGEDPPDMEMNDAGHEALKLQDAVKMSARVITYWEEEWTPGSLQAEREFPMMEKAAQLISNMTEGVEDEVLETWDGVGKISMQRVRIWLLTGAFDKSAPYRECYTIANEDGTNDVKSSNHLQDPETRFRCNQCPDAFDHAVKLEDHLCRNHSRYVYGVSKWLGKTLKHRVFGSLARGVGIVGRRENKQTGGGDDPAPNNREPGPNSSAPLVGGWLDVTSFSLREPLLQPVQCTTCSQTYTSLTTLRIHSQAEHNDIKDLKTTVVPVVQVGQKNAENGQVSGGVTE